MDIIKPTITSETKWSDIFSAYNSNFDAIKGYLLSGGSVNLSVTQQIESVVTFSEVEPIWHYVKVPTIVNPSDIVLVFVDGKLAIKKETNTTNYDYEIVENTMSHYKEGYYLVNRNKHTTDAKFTYLILNNKENTTQVQDWIDSINTIYTSASSLNTDTTSKLSNLSNLYQSILSKLDELEALVGSVYSAGFGLSLSNDRKFSVDTNSIQKKLTAGSHITISSDNVISSDGGLTRGTTTTFDDFTDIENNTMWEVKSDGSNNAVKVRVKVGSSNEFATDGQYVEYYRTIEIDNVGLISKIGALEEEVGFSIISHSHTVPDETNQSDSVLNTILESAINSSN